MVCIERLPFGIFLEQGLAQASEQVVPVDVGAGIVDEYAGFHISGRVDVAVVPSSSDAASDEFPVVLEIDGKQGYGTVTAADLPDPPDHIGTLFRSGQQIQRGFIAYRHVMEEPAVPGSVVHQHLEETVTGDGLDVLPGVADGSPEENPVFLQEGHGMHHLIEITFASAAVVDFPVAFDTDGEAQVPYFSHLAAESIIDQSAIGEGMEFTVWVSPTEPQDICFPD